MQYGVLDILSLIGSLVLFLFGMRLLSEALQKVAGKGMRNILQRMTKKPLTGVFSGIFLTGILQSSSATTVMFISFVNAGLLTLTESISLIMGANIGTTVTSWLIALLGFKLDIVTLCLPLIAITFPLIFSKKNKLRAWGEVIVGFALLFLALDFLKSAVPDINNNPHLLHFLADYNISGIGGILLFTLVGFIFTLIIQSSSASLALIIVMCGNGWIGFELAAAMVIGTNMGTTITANIAAIIANAEAKKSALAHLFFNVFSAIFAIIAFDQLIFISDWITQKIENQSAFLTPAAIPIGLAAFHSLFNILGVILLISFIRPMAKFLHKLIPTKRKVHYGLKYINTGILSTSELSIIQARKEVSNFGKNASEMFVLCRKMFKETDEKRIEQFSIKLSDFERQMDNNEIEIANYLSTISENDLSINATKRIRSLIKISDNIESIADNIYNLSKLLLRKSKQRTWFTPELRSSVNEMFDLLDNSFKQMQENMLNSRLAKDINITTAEQIETEINDCRNFLKQENMQNIKKKEYRYQAGVTFLDIISISESIGDHLFSISETLFETETDKAN